MTKTETKETLQAKIKELGRFPTLDEFSEALNLKNRQTEQVLAILVGDGFIHRNSDGVYQLSQRERKVSGAVSSNVKPEKELEINTLDNTESVPDITEVTTEAHFTQTGEPETESLKMSREASETLPPTEEKTHSNPELLSKYKRTREKVVNWCVNCKNTFKRKPKTSFRKKTQPVSSVIVIIRVVMSFVGIGAAVISMFYTSRFTLELFPHASLAYLLSAIMVGFNIMAFELILLFGTKQATDHWFRWLAAFVFFTLWTIVGGFSITATVAGQYNEHARTTTKVAMDSGSPKVLAVKYTNILSRKRLYYKQINDAQAQNDVLNKKQDEIKNDPEQLVLFQQNSWAITANNKIITNATTQHNKAIEEETALINTHPEVVSMDKTESGAEVPDFYGWLAKVFGKSRDIIQFWTSLMPAIFVDVMAPIALAAALFLRGKK